MSQRVGKIGSQFENIFSMKYSEKNNIVFVTKLNTPHVVLL